MVGLLVLNLDRFKRINDTLGHRSGDELLRAVARRLVMAARRSAPASAESPASVPIARLSGDEFAIVLAGLRSSEEAAQAARHVLDVLGTPFSLEGADVVMTASLGIAVHPADGSDADTLLRSANTAMRHAKTDGGDTYWFFNRSMNERALRNLRIENGLRSALERSELVIHYQPQRSAISGGITGMEALVRWRSEEFGLVKPVEFIPLAEETGIIAPLGEWVIRTACEQAAAWEREGMPPLRLAVNVSSQQMRRPELLDIVERSVRDAGLDPRRLELEITESTLLSDGDSVMHNLQGLRRMGVRLALDDFGTGFSSLSHLVQFPIDTLKIDQSFVKEIGAEGQADAIVGAVVAMAHQLGLNVVAEGVETALQEEFLLSEGCDVLQGFRIGHPLEPERFVATLRGGGSRR
jgi:diguanylate cyclase (GGDEF)-like protein